MKPYQAIGYALLNTTTITAIVGSRVNHGLRPIGTTTPCINYFELGGMSRLPGMESMVFSINCRADSADDARNIGRLVIDLFDGTNGTGTYGNQVTFEISRASLNNDNGLIPEPEDGIYNAPIDIRIVYPISAS
jgi:hypothetical protein